MIGFDKESHTIKIYILLIRMTEDIVSPIILSFHKDLSKSYTYKDLYLPTCDLGVNEMDENHARL